MIIHFGHVNIARIINRDTGWVPEFTVSRAITAPDHQQISAGREFLNPIVEAINHVEVVLRIESESVRAIELSVTGAKGSPLSDEPAVRSEYLDAMIPKIGNINVVR